ncbi:MAG: methionyl-tRNA formyltransferase [Gemmatimonadota bacterium]|nr:methionyl-tRNA formyltransferase [Gemmatimonadota bacterium]
MRVMFWGTPEFAAPALRALVGEGFDVCAVVTRPDKPVGRDRVMTEPPVKTIALRESLPVFQPSSPKEEDFFELIEVVAPDVSVVVAYGHILPRAIIDLPRLGTLNIHASLLPALRGAAPIQAAIRDGLTETGVTIMRMEPALDSGPIVLQSRTPIADDETYGELQGRLSELGALALIEALTLIGLSQAGERPQDHSLATYARKVDRDTTRINWSRSASEVANAISAYDPRPGAWTIFRGADLKLFGARRLFEISGAPGEVLDAGPDGLTVACGSGAVRICDVQPSGKRRMEAIDWHRGRGIAIGDRLGTDFT